MLHRLNSFNERDSHKDERPDWLARTVYSTMTGYSIECVAQQELTKPDPRSRTHVLELQSFSRLRFV
jgi:hypothetical protein